MNIAFLLPDTNISGRSRTVAEQAVALAARGHRVRIVGEDDPPPAHDEIVIEELPPIVIVNDLFYSSSTLSPLAGRGVRGEGHPFRVLLVGVSPEDGYGAAAHARWFHQTFELVRVAPFAPSRAEPLDAVQEFHVALSTPEMARVVHSCDVVIAPTFGLAVAEAMAAGLAVASIEKPDHPVELGERLIEVLSDESLRARLRAESREKAEEWRSERGGELLEQWLLR
jgi:hypothetical protein